MPKMQHPDRKGRIDVKDDMVPVYETQGWRVVETKKSSESTKGSK